MCCRTGTLRHGFRLGGSRMSPAGRSMVPGVATPMAATCSGRRPAARTAWRIDSHICSSPCSWPLRGSVGRLTALSVRPLSSTTPAFMVVPPTSRPTNRSGDVMKVSISRVRDERHLLGGTPIALETDEHDLVFGDQYLAPRLAVVGAEDKFIRLDRAGLERRSLHLVGQKAEVIGHQPGHDKQQDVAGEGGEEGAALLLQPFHASD